MLFRLDEWRLMLARTMFGESRQSANHLQFNGKGDSSLLPGMF